MPTTRKQDLERHKAKYIQLLNLLEIMTLHLKHPTSQAIMNVAKTTLEADIVGSHDSSPGDISSFIKSCLPPIAAVFSPKFLSAQPFPIKLLKVDAALYGCFAPPDEMVSSVGDAKLQLNTNPLLNVLVIISSYQYNRRRKNIHAKGCL